MVIMIVALCLGLCIMLYWNVTVVLAICLGLYIGLHWHTRKSVDEYNHGGENKRHIHRHWERD